MLLHPTIEALKALRLFGMVTALEEQQRTDQWQALSFEERLGLLVDRQRIDQENRSMTAFGNGAPGWANRPRSRMWTWAQGADWIDHCSRHFRPALGSPGIRIS